jgi:hypothetical protein
MPGCQSGNLPISFFLQKPAHGQSVTCRETKPGDSVWLEKSNAGPIQLWGIPKTWTIRMSMMQNRSRVIMLHPRVGNIHQFVRFINSCIPGKALHFETIDSESMNHSTGDPNASEPERPLH